MRLSSVLIGFAILVLNCGSKQPGQGNIITIIDIGNKDRIHLGKQLRIINNNSPKVVALDFFLVPDSLSKDSILVKELYRSPHIVQVVALHKLDSASNSWDSLEVSNPKFRVSEQGFSNITITEDSVFVRELELNQKYRNKVIPSFSYAIAKGYSRVKPEYRNTGLKAIRFPYLRLESGYKIIRNEDLTSGNFAKSDIQDKIVIMGYIGYGDDFYLDHGRQWKVNGVAIHAAIVNELLDQ